MGSTQRASSHPVPIPESLGVSLLSIPRSRTHFFRSAIKPEFTLHIHDKRAPDAIVNSEHVAFIVRRPEHVWRSMWWRGEWNDGDGPDGRWFEAWRLFAQLANLRHDIHYLPIDTEDRQKRLWAFGRKVGRDFNPDWDEPANEYSSAKTEPPLISFNWIYDTIPVIRQFYAEPRSNYV